MKKIRFAALLLSGMLLLTLLAGCGASEKPDDSKPSNSSSEQSEENAVVRTNFEVGFLGEEKESETYRFSLNLPALWTADDQTADIFEGETWVAGVEMFRPSDDPTQPFADIDATYVNLYEDSVVSSKEWAAGGYPVKRYVLTAESESAGTAAQYIYYIAVGDATLVIFFAADEVSPEAELAFDEIVSSFIPAQL